MPALDIRTLVFAANLVSLTMAAAFVVSGIIGWRDSRALSCWAGGFLAKAAGQILVFSRPLIPYFFSFAVANGLAVFGTALFWVGVTEYIRPRQPMRTRLSLAVAAATVTLIVWTLAGYLVSSAVLNGFVALFDVAGALVLLREQRPGLRGVHAFVLCAFAVDAVGALLRIISLVAGWAPLSLFEPSPFTVAYYVEVATMRALLGIGMLMLLYRQAHVAERAKVIELQEALDRVKNLEGLLPICAWCKRIQSDQGRGWESVEQYVALHSNAFFSHTICPECAVKVEHGYRPQAVRLDP